MHCVGIGRSSPRFFQMKANVVFHKDVEERDLNYLVLEQSGFATIMFLKIVVWFWKSVSANRQENNLNIADLFAFFAGDYFGCPFMSSGFVSIGIVFALWNFYGGGGGALFALFLTSRSLTG